MRTLEFDRNLGHLVEAVEMMDLAHGETPKCTLFTSSFDYAIQGVLGLLALASLWVKFRIFDDVKARSFYTWTLDTAKQAFGGILAHFLNIGMAKRLHQSVKEMRTADECDFYFINFVLDTIFGLLLLLAVLRSYEYIVHSILFPHRSVPRTGEYGSPPSITVWLYQCLVWVLMVAITKSAIFIVEMMFLHEIDHSGYYLLFPLHQAPKVKLILVMVVAPLVMTSCGFWMVDTWIMGANNSSASNNDTRQKTGEYSETSNADATGLMSKDIAEAGAYHDDAIVIKAPRAHRHPKYISGESDVNDDDGAEAVRTCFLATGDSTSRGGGGDNDNERSVREEEEEGLLVATTR